MKHHYRKARRYLEGRVFGSRRDTRLAIMLHPGRTGSTLLGDLLGQHERIDWASEVFSKIQPSERGYLLKNALWRLRNPVSRDADGHILWQQSLAARCRRSPAPVLGVEIKTGQVFRQGIFGENLSDSLARLTEAADFPLIFLRRVNHLDRYISTASAKRRSHYNFTPGQTPEPIEVPVRRQILDAAYFRDKMEINSWLDRVEALEEEISVMVSAGGGLCLTYEEDILPSPSIAYNKIIAHLNEDPGEVVSRFIKIDPRPLAERVSNFERLGKILRPDLFERYCGP